MAARKSPGRSNLPSQQLVEEELKEGKSEEEAVPYWRVVKEV